MDPWQNGELFILKAKSLLKMDLAKGEWFDLYVHNDDS
jgi:hypothetical protein